MTHKKFVTMWGDGCSLYCGDHFTIYVNQSLCCTPETNTVLYINEIYVSYISIKWGEEAIKSHPWWRNSSTCLNCCPAMSWLVILVELFFCASLCSPVKKSDSTMCTYLLGLRTLLAGGQNQCLTHTRQAGVITIMEKPVFKTISKIHWVYFFQNLMNITLSPYFHIEAIPQREEQSLYSASSFLLDLETSS